MLRQSVCLHRFRGTSKFAFRKFLLALQSKLNPQKNNNAIRIPKARLPCLLVFELQRVCLSIISHLLFPRLLKVKIQ